MKMRSRLMKSINDSLDLSVRFTRRTATVTISAPAAPWASAMIVCEGYLPVPTTRRDPNVRPAMTRGSEIIKKAQGSRNNRLTTAHKSDDFNLVAIVDKRLIIMLVRTHDKLVLDRDDAR